MWRMIRNYCLLKLIFATELERRIIRAPKVVNLPEDRYPKQLFNQEWNIKPRRGRQRKVWSRTVDDLFKSLDINKSEWVEDSKYRDS